MQQTRYRTCSLIQQIARRGTWVLVVSMFIVACGSESQEVDNSAAVTTQESVEARDTSERDTPTPPLPTPSAVATGADHQHMTRGPDTATATSASVSTATAILTNTPVHTAHGESPVTATIDPDSTAVTEVQILDFSFEPQILEVNAGTTVTFVNQGVDHTATSLDDPGIFDTGILHTGESFSVTFDTAGTFDYWCMLHPNMVGTVVVK